MSSWPASSRSPRCCSPPHRTDDRSCVCSVRDLVSAPRQARTGLGSRCSRASSEPATHDAEAGWRRSSACSPPSRGRAGAYSSWRISIGPIPDTAAVVEYIGDNVGALPILSVTTLRPTVSTPAYRVVRALESRGTGTVIDPRRMGPRRPAEPGRAPCHLPTCTPRPGGRRSSTDGRCWFAPWTMEVLARRCATTLAACPWRCSRTSARFGGHSRSGGRLHDEGAGRAGQGGINLAPARAAVVARRRDVANRAREEARAEAVAWRDDVRLAAAQAIEAPMAFEGGLVDAERWFDRMVDLASHQGLWTWRLRGPMERASLDALRALPRPGQHRPQPSHRHRGPIPSRSRPSARRAATSPSAPTTSRCPHPTSPVSSALRPSTTSRSCAEKEAA
jgi:hypothetical protein